MMLALAACARGGVESDGKACCAPPPIETYPPAEPEGCRASGGVMTEYGSTCGDSCEMLRGSLCGDMMTTQCECPRGQCWSGWSCVPDACAPLYTQQALEALAEDPTRRTEERIEARLEQLRTTAASKEREAALSFKKWLEAEFRRVTYHLRTPDEVAINPADFYKHVNDPLVVSFAVRIPLNTLNFTWMPKQPVAIKDDFEWSR
jgi:hypothetical protein